MDISIEVLMILVLILVNGVLAMAEFAIVAARKGRLQGRVAQGDQRAKIALELADEPADFLSTVQIGITLIGVLAGAFGGATIAEALEDSLGKVVFLAPYAEGISVGIVVLLITVLSLIFGELAPKRLALNRSESLAILLAPSMKTLSRLASPLVRLLSDTTDWVLRILGVEKSEEAPVTEDEIRLMIAQATKSGEIQKEEQNMVSGVFRLGDRRVGTLITPRTEIEWLDLEDSLENNLLKINASRHSCFPIARGDLDQIQGVVAAKEVLRCCLDGSTIHLEDCMIPPTFVPENTPALTLLDLYQSSEPQLVIVIDEYGGVQGLLTIRDILDAIVGDFPFASQVGERPIFRRDDQSWLVDGLLPVDEFMDAFQIQEMPDYDRGHYQTIGGFVMNQLGKIPTTGDSFDWGGYEFEIVDMDGLRVDKILIKKPAQIPGPAENL